MSEAVPKNDNAEPARVLGRGLRAKRGVRITLRTLRDGVDTPKLLLPKSWVFTRQMFRAWRGDPILTTVKSQRSDVTLRH